MMNSPWPSFFGHLFDYSFEQGGGYFGAQEAMPPVRVVGDYYATADRSTHVYVVNQTAEPPRHVSVSVALYNVDGTRKYVNEAKDIELAPYSSGRTNSSPWQRRLAVAPSSWSLDRRSRRSPASMSWL